MKKREFSQMMRRTASVLLAGLLVIGMLGGCSKKPSASESTDSVNTENTDSAKAESNDKDESGGNAGEDTPGNEELGDLYLSNDDYENAYKYYKKAADAGEISEDGIFTLGLMTGLGLGCEYNLDEAVSLLKQAGYTEKQAYSDLAYYYRFGIESDSITHPINLDRAKELYEAAERKFNPDRDFSELMESLKADIAAGNYSPGSYRIIEEGAAGYKGKLFLYIYENPGYGNTNQVIDYFGYPDELDLYAYLGGVSVWNVYGGPSSQATILPEDMRYDDEYVYGFYTEPKNENEPEFRREGPYSGLSIHTYNKNTGMFERVIDVAEGDDEYEEYKAKYDAATPIAPVPVE